MSEIPKNPRLPTTIEANQALVKPAVLNDLGKFVRTLPPAGRIDFF
jgi:hypothetical protein